ncbi:MAG: class I SAM-dependent methyltransferase [Candidatus Omnitrophica bacterium]|nr:class I SAM-dependent methyltransferase [Candidatus Omnitrophota bacterium]
MDTAENIKHYSAMTENLKGFQKTTLNYYRWIFEIISPYAGKRILEVGSGGGLLAQFFHNYEIYYASDIFAPYLEILKERIGKRINTHIIELDISKDKDEYNFLHAFRFDTVICAGVIEHLLDDLKAFSNMAHILRKGGRLIIFAPALGLLYGKNDYALGHFRRYSKIEMISKVKKAGLDLEDIFYNNFFGIFPWFYVGKIMRKSTASELQFKAFDRIVPILKAAERYIRPFAGLNLVCIGKKEKQKLFPSCIKTQIK